MGKNVARPPAPTPGLHKPGTTVFAKLITVEYKFRNRRSLVFILVQTLTSKSLWIGVETRTVLIELLVWGVRGDPVLVSPFL